MGGSVISPELSRRLAVVMDSPVVQAEGLEWKFALVKAAEAARTFSRLPADMRKVVLRAERLLKKG